MKSKKLNEQLEKLLMKAEEDRDIDVCLVLDQKARVKAFDKRLEYSEYRNIDVNIFQALPLYIQKRILEEGIIRFCKDEDALYDIAIKAVKEFELFKPKYELYLEGVASG